MNKHVMPASFLVAISGLMVTAAMTLGDGKGPQSPAATQGIDMSVSAVAASTSGGQSISVDATGAATGMFGLAMGTTSCNVGSVYIPFQAAMQYNHPYIVQNVYRTNKDGRLEQLSASWIKHAFSSASTSQAAVSGVNGQPACGTGSCDGVGGVQMGFNCSDTYGPSLNAGTYYLGPRSELKPNDVGFVGTTGLPPTGRTWLGWKPRGSFFDNYTSSGANDLVASTGQNDAARSYTTGSAGTPWKVNYIRDDEITTGATGALGTTGRLYFEAFYDTNGDVSKFNNHAHRRHRVSGTRTFAQDGPHTFGPVILQWGDQQQLAQPNTEGSVYVASRVVPLGNGQWRYEYNVYNLDFNRQLTKIEIPSLPYADRSQIGFWQPRQYTPAVSPALAYSTDPWVNMYDPTKLTMTFNAPEVPRGTGGAPTTQQLNSIRWGTMYTMWYTSNLPPRSNGVATIYPNPDKPSNDPFDTINPTPSTLLAMQARVSVPRNPADIVGVGGNPVPDGIVSGDDFNAFIAAFNNQDPLADIASIGLILGADGIVDGNDFIAFINYFVQQ